MTKRNNNNYIDDNRSNSSWSGEWCSSSCFTSFLSNINSTTTNMRRASESNESYQKRYLLSFFDALLFFSTESTGSGPSKSSSSSSFSWEVSLFLFLLHHITRQEEKKIEVYALLLSILITKEREVSQPHMLLTDILTGDILYVTFSFSSTPPTISIIIILLSIVFGSLDKRSSLL